jgi:hypothetical protein
MARPSRAAKKQTDFNSIVVPQGVTIEGELKFKPHEDDQEKIHRIRTDARSFWIKEAPVYIVALMILITTATYCFWVLWHPGFAKDDRQWAMSTLTSLLVGIVGYVFGKATK